MKAKHDVSVLDLVDMGINNPGSLTEDLIDEKFGDKINYTLLLKGMVLDRMRKYRDVHIILPQEMAETGKSAG